MLTWSTDGLPANQRFDHWREERGRQFFGVTIELPPERRNWFEGRFSARQAGCATIASLSASAYRVGRTNADVARLAKDSLVIGLQVAGPGWCDTPAGRAFVDVGSIALGHTDLPYQSTPSTEGRFLIHMLTIPVARLGPEGEAARGLHLASLPDGHPAMLLDAAVSALFDGADNLSRQAADEAVDHIGRLALLSRGAVSSRSPESRGALRAGLRHAALRFMRRNLHRARLTPDAAAKALGISPRQLHLIFEPTGLSFQRTLNAMRVDVACRLLGEASARPVADIAFSCGFDSLATFYRTFRSATGMTPVDWRHAAT